MGLLLIDSLYECVRFCCGVVSNLSGRLRPTTLLLVSTSTAVYYCCTVPQLVVDHLGPNLPFSDVVQDLIRGIQIRSNPRDLK